jgi:predicted ATPase
MRAPQAPEMLLLLTYRTEYIGLSACLKALNVEDSRQERDTNNTLALQPLSSEDGLKLALELLGNDNREQAEWIMRESRGTAFFIYELARYVRTHAQAHTSLPADVNLDSVLWQRVSQLPGDSMRLLEFISVAGEPLPLRTIQSAGGLNNLPPQVITQLRSAHLVRTAGPSLDDEIECYHDRVRETVKEHLVADTRRSHHGSLANTLETTGASADKLAPHFEFAGKLDRAAQCYAKAADEAAAALAFNRAEEHYLKAIELTTDPVVRAAVQEKMIHFYTDTTRFPEAYKVTRDAVRTFGISLPPKFIPPLLIGDFLLSKWYMRGLKPADILSHREMTDPRLKAAVSLINAGAKAAYQVRPELCVAISTRAVNLCLQHGITPECAIGWMVYGTIFQGGIIGQHALGYDFGKLALGLIDKFQNNRQRAEVNFVVGYFGTSWMQPAREAEALWQKAWQAGLDSGDLFHTGCAGASLVMSQFMRGLPFDDVLAEADRIMPTLERASLREPIGVLTAVRQAIRNLRGQTQAPDTFTDADFDESEHRKALANYGSRHFAHLFFILRLQTLYLRGLHEKAAEFAKLSACYLKDSPGMLHSAEHHFYEALNAAVLAIKATGFKRWKLKQQVSATQKRFTKWSINCAENFAARAHLLAAALAEVDGRTDSVLTACEAVKQTTQSLPLLALAEHFSTAAHQSMGRMEDAESSHNASRNHLAQWGASTKLALS